MLHLLAALTPGPVPQNLTFNRIVFAIIVLIHQQFATFLIGATTMALVSEGIAIARNDERHTRLAAGLVKSMVYSFSLGAAIAIFWVVVILLGVWGAFFSALTQITFWIFVVEAGAFLLEIILLYGIYANWARLARHRMARYGLLILLNVTFFWQFFLIDVVASYMLTPNGGDVSQLNQVLNPTNLPLTLHRLIGNIAWAGALVAGFGAVMYLRAVKHEDQLARDHADGAPAALQPARSVGAMSAAWFQDTPEPAKARTGTLPGDRAFYDFVIQWGMLFAVGLTLFQPWVGYSYAKEIQLHAYSAWYAMMFGDLSNVFLLQITLLGLIFVLGAAFFWRRLRASGAPGARSARNVMILLIGVTIFAAIPSRFAWTYNDINTQVDAKPWWVGGLLNPIGAFIPNKVIALLLMMVGGLWALVTYLKAVSRNQIRWGEATRRTPRIVLALTVTVSAMMATMGIIREHSRQPYLVYGEITISHQEIVNAAPPQVQLKPANPTPPASTSGPGAPPASFQPHP